MFKQASDVNGTFNWHVGNENCSCFPTKVHVAIDKLSRLSKIFRLLWSTVHPNEFTVHSREDFATVSYIVLSRKTARIIITLQPGRFRDQFPDFG